MKFITLSPEEFENYAKNSPYKSFMQTPEIAKLRQNSGWTPYYYGVKDGDELKAAIMLVGKTTFMGHKTFYAPGGPLLDLENTSLTNFFFTHLKTELKNQKGYILRIDPYYELVERNRDGAAVEGGFNHEKALQNLKNLGFKPTENTDQPKYLFAMDIKPCPPEVLIMDFKRNTRNHIRKAEKMGVKVRELKREELNLLKDITESTSKRRGFEDRPLSYYEQMYDLFATKGEAKFLLAEVDSVVSEEYKRSAAGVRSTPRETLEETAESTSATPLSAAMFLLYGDEVIYLFSGSDEKYMKEYNAQYLIQWHMIKYATEHGFKRYNFYGIGGLPDPNSEDYGIYDFKKGFTNDQTGHVIELIGSFELSLSPLQSAKKLLKKVKR